MKRWTGLNWLLIQFIGRLVQTLSGLLSPIDGGEFLDHVVKKYIYIYI